MALWKMTFVWSQGEFGASENWWFDDNSNANTAAKRVMDFLTARTEIMFTNQLVTGVRLSRAGLKRRGILLPPGTTPWPTRDQVVTVPRTGDFGITATRTPELIRVAANMRMTFGSEDDPRVSTRYLSSIPDGIVTYEPGGIVTGAVPVWWNLWKRFRSLLVATPYFINAKDYDGPGQNRPVSVVTQQAAAPSLVGIGIATSVAPGWTAGQVISLTGFKMTDSCVCPSINGAWIIDTVNTTDITGYTVFYLRSSSNVDPNSVRRLGNARLDLTALLAIRDALLVRGGIHQRGNAGLRRRGRRSIRCCPVR